VSAPSSVVEFSWPSEGVFFFDLLSSLKTLTWEYQPDAFIEH
jgi:hypothetical protein